MYVCVCTACLHSIKRIEIHRVMAAAFTTFIGRVGCFAGNGLFGYLIDDYCVPLISIIAGQFFREYFFVLFFLCFHVALLSYRRVVLRDKNDC